MLIIAHRGVGEPRNTLDAFRRASKFDALDRVIFSSTDPGVLSDVRRLSGRARLAFSIVRERDVATFPWLKAGLRPYPLHVPLDGVDRVGMPVLKLLVRWARLIGLRIGF